MKKKIVKRDVFYSIMWSTIFPYDKYSISRILPEMSGIVCLLKNRPKRDPEYLIFYGCWRDGLRKGLKNLFDPVYSKLPEIRDDIETRDLLYKYTVVDSNPIDMKDIMFRLMRDYKPKYNNYRGFRESGRYENIYIMETTMKKGQYVERFPDHNL